ncbi:MAG TPA: hypothetical protein PLQ67_06735 [Burkholderiaceae bacterium]|nr:hypothetical protein [Burkholderiaceae bacterium]
MPPKTARLSNSQTHESGLTLAAGFVRTVAIRAPAVYLPLKATALAIAAGLSGAAAIDTWLRGDLQFHTHTPQPQRLDRPAHPNGPTLITGAEKIDSPTLAGKPAAADQPPVPGTEAHTDENDRPAGYQAHTPKADEYTHLSEAFIKHQELMGLSVGSKLVTDASTYQHVDPNLPVRIEQTVLGDTIASAGMVIDGERRLVTIKVAGSVALVESDFETRTQSMEDLQVELELFKRALSELHASQVPISKVSLLLPALEYEGSGFSPSARKLMPLTERASEGMQRSLPAGISQGQLGRDALALPVAEALSLAGMELSAIKKSTDHIEIKFALPANNSKKRFNELYEQLHTAPANHRQLN